MRTASQLPSVFKKIVVKELSQDFRQCCALQEAPMPADVRPTEVIVRNRYVGINASDINFTAGAYKPGVKPPMDCGMESIGEVVAVGSAVTTIALGDPVISQSFGAFSEYQVVPSRSVRRVPSLDVDFLPLEISGCTAAICLGEVIQPRGGETALVTAAAGGTGQFAVQLLARAGCKVIGTCSTPEKAAYLRSIGCDRPIITSQEDVSAVLKKEFPTGVNIVYESVGGPLFEAAVSNLALRGRIVTIGSITGYKDGSSFTPEGAPKINLPTVLLQKSATLRGFFLPHFAKYSQKYFADLLEMHRHGHLKSGVDKLSLDVFSKNGLSDVFDAVDYLHSGRNTGKVVVKVQ